MKMKVDFFTSLNIDSFCVLYLGEVFATHPQRDLFFSGL